ncbi:MAG: LamG domain-containing protein [Acidobacteria bacterium]|nr:LamG domain-containing protein [Acidobacteriota bacterium]
MSDLWRLALGHRLGQGASRSLPVGPIEVVNFDPANVTLVGGKVDTVYGVLLESVWVQATDAARPVHTTSGPLGRSGAVFAGGQRLDTDNPTICAAIAGDDTPFSWIALADVTVDGAIRHVLASQVAGVATAGRYAFGHDAALKSSARKSSIVLTGAADLTSGLHAFSMDTAADTNLYIDGVLALSGATNDSDRATDSMSIGGQMAANYLNGTVVEIAIYDRRVTASDRALWAAYWGVPV